MFVALNACACALLCFMAYMTAVSGAEYIVHVTRAPNVMERTGFEECRERLPYLIRASALSAEPLDVRNSSLAWCAQDYRVFRAAFEQSRALPLDRRPHMGIWRVRVQCDTSAYTCLFMNMLHARPPTDVDVYHVDARTHQRTLYAPYARLYYMLWCGGDTLDVELLARAS
jgi:hypothetical protein